MRKIIQRSFIWLEITALAAIAVGIPAWPFLSRVLPWDAGLLAAASLVALLSFSAAGATLQERAGTPPRIRIALHSGLLVMGKAATVLFGIELLAIGARIAVVFVPPLEEPVSSALDPLFSPAWNALEGLATAAGSPEAVAGVAVGPILLFGVLLVTRNAAHQGLDSENRVRHASAGAHRRSMVSADAGDGGELGAAGGAGGRKKRGRSGPILEPVEMDLTFLAIDVVDVGQLKDGEDPYVVDHSFTAYRRLVERYLGRYRAYKQTWTPDGQMAAFHSPQAAVWCAREILRKLEHFNEKKSRMKKDFRVRAGANLGEVSTDDQTPMEQISDFAIDVAGHLQKHADPNSLWISGKVYERLTEKDEFTPVSQKVDGRDVYAWRLDA